MLHDMKQSLCHINNFTSGKHHAKSPRVLDILLQSLQTILKKNKIYTRILMVPNLRYVSQLIKFKVASCQKCYSESWLFPISHDSSSLATCNKCKTVQPQNGNLNIYVPIMFSVFISIFLSWLF